MNGCCLPACLVLTELLQKKNEVVRILAATVAVTRIVTALPCLEPGPGAWSCSGSCPSWIFLPVPATSKKFVELTKSDTPRHQDREAATCRGRGLN